MNSTCTMRFIGPLRARQPSPLWPGLPKFSRPYTKTLQRVARSLRTIAVLSCFFSMTCNATHDLQEGSLVRFKAKGGETNPNEQYKVGWKDDLTDSGWVRL